MVNINDRQRSRKGQKYINKALKAREESRSIMHAEDLFKYHKYICVLEHLMRMLPKNKEVVKRYEILTKKLSWQQEFITNFTTSEFASVQPVLSQTTPNNNKTLVDE
jgi:hypothetical protein